MSAICTSELLDGIPIVRLRVGMLDAVLKEYFRRYADGKAFDRERSIVISGMTGVILIINGVMCLKMNDEWYPVRNNDFPGGIECKFDGDGRLLVRKHMWTNWVKHSNECRSYPSVKDGVCAKSDVICVIDIVPDDQENYVPGELYERVRA